MKISKNGLDLIKKYEGLSLHPYLCPAGIPTIGYGSTYYPFNIKVKMSDAPITLAEAEELLGYTVNNTFSKAVNSLVTVPLTQNQFDALISFTYNLGVGALKSSTLLKKLNAEDYAGAALQLLRWNKDGKKVLAGLTARRASEKALFES